MTNRKRILPYRTQTSGIKPNAEDLENGEIAINYAAGEEKLFTKNNLGEVVSFPSESSLVDYAKKWGGNVKLSPLIKFLLCWVLTT